MLQVSRGPLGKVLTITIEQGDKLLGMTVLKKGIQIEFRNVKFG